MKTILFLVALHFQIIQSGFIDFVADILLNQNNMKAGFTFKFDNIMKYESMAPHGGYLDYAYINFFCAYRRTLLKTV